jgi:hypothetical protein
MAQRQNRPSNSGRPAAGSAAGGGRRRTPPPAVKKPFPWGVAATSGVLGLLLIAIVVYAVANQGSGFTDPLKKADQSFSGLSVSTGLARDHVEGTVQYPKSPPVGGKHNPTWENCGVYGVPVANEHAVHSLEHGAVWITYRPDLPADQIKALDAYGTRGYVLVTPYPGLSSPVSLQAWGRQLKVQSAGDPVVDKFVTTYMQGPQTPEQGAACTNGTSATGPLTPTRTASAAPSATPTK